jgi:ERF superfamily
MAESHLITTDVGTIGSTLASKLAAVMAAVDRVPKRGWNAVHGYHYPLEADVLEVIRGLLAERNVVLLPAIVGWRRDPIGEKGQVLTTLEMEFTFLDGDTGERETRAWIGTGTDNQDKGAYKAMTGAEKYFLLKGFLIPTGDDPETDAEETTPPTVAAKPPASGPAVVKPPAAPSPAKPKPVTQPSPSEPARRVTRVWIGTSGKNNRGPWTMWIVQLQDGKELKTFDEDVAIAAEEAVASGALVHVTAGTDGKIATFEVAA